jgi:hypothetical protein
VLLCLFDCFELHEQFFSYLGAVTITGDRAVNLDLWLAIWAFSSEGSFTCQTDSGPPFLRSYSKDLWFLLLNAVLLAKKQLLPIFNILGLTWPARVGLKLATSQMLNRSTTTWLPQPVLSCACISWQWLGKNNEIVYRWHKTFLSLVAI